MSEDSLPFERV